MFISSRDVHTRSAKLLKKSSQSLFFFFTNSFPGKSVLAVFTFFFFFFVPKTWMSYFGAKPIIHSHFILKTTTHCQNKKVKETLTLSYLLIKLGPSCFHIHTVILNCKKKKQPKHIRTYWAASNIKSWKVSTCFIGAFISCVDSSCLFCSCAVDDEHCWCLNNKVRLWLKIILHYSKFHNPWRGKTDNLTDGCMKMIKKRAVSGL